MANPGPVAAALWTDEEVEAGVQLDSIVTVVDAINIDRQLHAKRADGKVNEAQVQVGQREEANEMMSTDVSNVARSWTAR
jgi:G3E family GTPase